MRLVQFVSGNDERRVGRVGDDDSSVQVLSRVGTTYELAQRAAREGRPLEDLAAAAGDSEILDLAELLPKAACSRRSTIPIPRIAWSPAPG